MISQMSWKFGTIRPQTEELAALERLKNRLLSCYLSSTFIMPPTLKKWGHIGFGLFVCMYVCMYGASRYCLKTSCIDS